MAEFVIHTTESAPAESREAMRAVQQKFGFLPNLIGGLAAAPAAVKAYVALNELVGQTSFAEVEQQLILTATSVANGCEYCVAAHSAGLEMAGLPGAQIAAVREARPLADARLEALRRFTTVVVENRGRPTEAELEAFLSAGYTEAQVLELLVGVAMKTLSNYTNHIVGTPLDEPLAGFAWESTAA